MRLDTVGMIPPLEGGCLTPVGQDRQILTVRARQSPNYLRGDIREGQAPRPTEPRGGMR